MAGTEVKKRIPISRERLWQLAVARVAGGAVTLDEALFWAADELVHLEEEPTVGRVVHPVDVRERDRLAADGRERVQRFDLSGEGPVVEVERLERPKA